MSVVQPSQAKMSQGMAGNAWENSLQMGDVYQVNMQILGYSTWIKRNQLKTLLTKELC